MEQGRLQQAGCESAADKSAGMDFHLGSFPIVKQTQLALLNCYPHFVATSKTSHKKHKQLLAPSPVIPQSCRNRFSCETLVFGLPLPLFPEFDSGHTANIWIFDTEACIIVSQSAHDMHRSAAGQEAEIRPAAGSDKRG